MRHGDRLTKLKPAPCIAVMEGRDPAMTGGIAPDRGFIRAGSAPPAATDTKEETIRKETK